jgi:ubiquinone/menaquinone biosynthesis C-methylase UbiE
LVSSRTTLHRWERAQKSEESFWLVTKKSWTVDLTKRYWQERLAHGFNLDYSYFTGKDVLEVGCGPSGIIYHLDEVKTSVGLEPLDLNNLARKNWKKTSVAKGIGEKIPFQDNSFDVILSYNSIDHSFDPKKVIEEIYRVLRLGGDFLLSLHILRDQFNLLKSILNKFDEPHPYHLTHKEVLRLLKDNSFYLNNSKRDKGIGELNDSLKKTIANYMMDRLWLWLVKKN